MRLRAFRALAATALTAILVTGGVVTANAATSSEVDVLTAATATWSTAGALSVTYSWEDHRTAADAAPGAVMIYVNTGQAWFQTTALGSSGTGTYTGTFSTSASPATLRLSVETYTCSTDGSCLAPSLADAEWVVTIAPGQTLSYTRPTPADPSPAPTATPTATPTPTPTATATATPSPPPVTAPPVAAAKHRTSLTASSVHRTGSKLTGKIALTDLQAGTKLAESVQLQRRQAEGWRTVSTVRVGTFTARVPKATYRLHYVGTSEYLPSSSRTFAK
jgi:hypothetical protein